MSESEELELSEDEQHDVDKAWRELRAAREVYDELQPVEDMQWEQLAALKAKLKKWHATEKANLAHLRQLLLDGDTRAFGALVETHQQLRIIADMNADLAPINEHGHSVWDRLIMKSGRRGPLNRARSTIQNYERFLRRYGIDPDGD